MIQGKTWKDLKKLIKVLYLIEFNNIYSTGTPKNPGWRHSEHDSSDVSPAL